MMSRAVLDVAIVNVALPMIQRFFHDSDIGSLSWTLNVFNIVVAAAALAAGARRRPARASAGGAHRRVRRVHGRRHYRHG